MTRRWWGYMLVGAAIAEGAWWLLGFVALIMYNAGAVFTVAIGDALSTMVHEPGLILVRMGIGILYDEFGLGALLISAPLWAVLGAIGGVVWFVVASHICGKRRRTRGPVP